MCMAYCVRLYYGDPMNLTLTGWLLVKYHQSFVSPGFLEVGK